MFEMKVSHFSLKFITNAFTYTLYNNQYAIISNNIN